jgi:phage/plasmid-associated DNA primase
MLSPEDLDLIQRYAGSCLLHHNAAQQLLILRGPGDAGKGVLVRVLQHVLGESNTTQLRLNVAAERFEINQCAPCSLLLGQEADADFLSENSVNTLKAMVGGDALKCEAKGQNATFTRRGDWNVLVTTNHRLRVRLQGDVEAWRRRLLIVDAKGRGDRTTNIPDFERVLLAEEGPGILAWLVQGAVRHVAELEKIGRFELSSTQRERVENLLAESESARHFAEDCLEKCQGAQLTVQDAVEAYVEYADVKGWDVGPDRRRSAEIQQAILETHRVALSHDIKKAEGGKACRGWRHLRLRTTDAAGEDLL